LKRESKKKYEREKKIPIKFPKIAASHTKGERGPHTLNESRVGRLAVLLEMEARRPWISLHHHFLHERRVVVVVVVLGSGTVVVVEPGGGNNRDIIMCRGNRAIST
jgi:hypothetical protein